MDEPYTDEEIPYLMGQYQRAGATKKVNELVGVGNSRGLLVGRDDRGEGWELLDGNWESSVPFGQCWKMRGHAWLHWLGLGEPSSLALVVRANPKKLGEAVFHDALVLLEETEGEERQGVVRKLHVVPTDLPIGEPGQA